MPLCLKRQVSGGPSAPFLWSRADSCEGTARLPVAIPKQRLEDVRFSTASSLTMMCRHGLQACSLSPSVGERVQVLYWFERQRIKRVSEGFRDFTFTLRMLWASTRGSAGKCLTVQTGRASTRH